MAFSQFHDNIEKIHGIQIKLIAQRLIRIQIVEICFVVYIFNDFYN